MVTKMMYKNKLTNNIHTPWVFSVKGLDNTGPFA